MKQTHCTQMFWSNDRAKPQLGENPEEEFLIKEEYSENFLQHKNFFSWTIFDKMSLNWNNKQLPRKTCWLTVVWPAVQPSLMCCTTCTFCLDFCATRARVNVAVRPYHSAINATTLPWEMCSHVLLYDLSICCCTVNFWLPWKTCCCSSSRKSCHCC